MFKFRTLPLSLLGIAVIYALLVPWLQPLDPRDVDLGAVLQAPTFAHPFGTDSLGRDIWIRSAQALRMSLFLALLAAMFSTVLGVGLGVLAAWRGGWVDRIIMRVVDTTNALPHLLLAVLVVALWRGQWWAIVLSIVLTHWTQVARIVRSRLITEREADYVALAIASGAAPRSLWFTHLLPAVAPQAGIALVLQLPHAIWHESSLSFLGVGLPPESASLGLLLEDARGGILSGAWWLLAFPAGILVLVSWSTLSLTQPSRKRRAKFARARKGEPQHRTEVLPPANGLDVEAALGAVRVETLNLWLPQNHTPAGAEVQLLNDITFTAKPGEITVIVGHSGAGKSQLLRALAGLSPENSRRTGTIWLSGTVLSNAQLATARRQLLTFVPGSAGTALNPVRTVAAQLRQTLKLHNKSANRQDIHALLAQLSLSPNIAKRYPHELSGGQAQRVSLALGLATKTPMLLLDEPTSALDFHTRTVIQGVLQARAAAGHSIIMVTHDLELAASISDNICVMKNGAIVESGPVSQVLEDPSHPYTRSLVGSHG